MNNKDFLLEVIEVFFLGGGDVHVSASKIHFFKKLKTANGFF